MLLSNNMLLLFFSLLLANLLFQSYHELVFVTAFNFVPTTSTCRHHHRPHHPRHQRVHDAKSSSPSSSQVGLRLSSANLELFETNEGNINDDDDDDGIGVGIDLGTTNSAISYLDPETSNPVIINIPNNGRTMPSVVAFDNTDNNNDGLNLPLVGRDAVNWEERHQISAYRNIKRVIGTGANYVSLDTIKVVPHLLLGSRRNKSNDDDDDNVRDDDGNNNKKGKNKNKKNKKKKKKKKKKEKVTLVKLLQDAHDNPTLLRLLTTPSKDDDDDDDDNGSSTISPTMISSYILQKLLMVATTHTNQKITRAVIGIPAYFNDAQRDATKQAAMNSLPSISKVKLLREPEAAALAYGLEQLLSTKEEELVLVFDLGGGTYDVSMLLVGDGLTEIICTAGDAQLGGSNFDARIAQYIRTTLLAGSGSITSTTNSPIVSDAMVRAAEQIRIYLSNNRRVQLAIPLTDDGWMGLSDASNVILPMTTSSSTARSSTTGDDYTSPSDDSSSTFEHRSKNATHLFYEMTRKEAESICKEEFQALLRPIREVAIMAGALLPGDASPTIVASALEMEEAFIEAERSSTEEMVMDGGSASGSSSSGSSDTDEAALKALQAEIELKEAKKAQQKGRKKARQVAKNERKYREESRKIVDNAASVQAGPSDKVRADGISGRPISRVVLVGGATRMPAIHRLLAAVTGVAPQKTVDPDEAVALGCAVHVGVLDGREGSGTVLSPMQAAILRAVVEKQQKEGDGMFVDDFDDDDEFGDAEYF